MMAAQKVSQRLIDRLPSARGRLIASASLTKLTWFRVGGAAEVLFRPVDAADLAQFLANRPAEVPITVIGVGANLLVRDGGVDGVVIRLGRGLAAIAVEDAAVRAGAAAPSLKVALSAMKAGRAGLEFLAGIPGTVGGALRMNAGAYGCEMSDVVIEATAIDGHGKTHTLTPGELGFGYRRSAVPEDWIFTEARLRAPAGDKDRIAARIDEIRSTREDSQPTRSRTGGSTFINPPGRKAWELIEDAGCRGLSRGGAMVSDQHCNFLINTGEATAADIEALGEEVRRRVYQTSGIRLEWEIHRIGRPAQDGPLDIRGDRP